MTPDQSMLLRRLMLQGGAMPLGGTELVIARQFAKSGIAALQADTTSPDLVHVTLTAAGRDMAGDELRRRADELIGCTEGSAEEAELAAIADLLAVYEGAGE